MLNSVTLRDDVSHAGVLLIKVPHNYSRMLATAASLGFRTLGLLYPSTEGQNGCGQSRVAHPVDLNCTAKERYRVLTGEQTSNNTNITRPDSIVGRVASALRHLGWTAWLKGDAPAPADASDIGGSVRWDSVIVGGHSNGADHTAFLAKQLAVSRALLFSGPQDYVGYGGHDDPANVYHAPAAPWQHERGATDPARLFGFGVSGSNADPNSWECHSWHTGWEAERLRPPYVAVDAGLRKGNTSGWRGARRLVSNGQWPSPVANLDPWWHAHMGAAGDCCAPLAPGTGDGTGYGGRQLMWAPVLEHMLLSNLDEYGNNGTVDNASGCGNLTAVPPPSPPSPPPHTASFDFRNFESNVLPAYLPRFKVASGGSPSIASYGAVPHPTAATPYGARAAVKALYIANQLNISEAERDEWAAFFNGFQNRSGIWSNYSKDGSYPGDFTTLYLGTWEITDAFGLIGRKPKHNVSQFEAIASDPTTWAPNFLPIFDGTQAGCGTIHGCGHKLAAISVVLAASGHLQQYAPFYKWLLKNALAHLDKQTGEICPALCSANASLPECSQSLYDCLGGGMTYHSMLTFLNAEWPYPLKVQALALKLQKPDGLWSYMSDSMNFDGIYQLSRPCRQQRCDSSTIAKIEAACGKYVAAANVTLESVATTANVFDADFHHFPVCLATLAECQSWFPQMIRTARPWKTQTFP